MPGFDATGPQGQGAMTGWGQGRCGGDAKGVPPTAMGRGGFQGRGGGRGRGGFQGRQCGFGQGRGGYQGRGGFQGRRDLAAVSTGAAQSFEPMNEASAGDLEALKSEARVCAQTLERINARIAALETQPASTESTEST